MLIASSTPTGDYRVETPEPARATDTANIAGQTDGVKSANLFAGFTDPGLTVSTASSVKYVGRAAGGVILQSTYACRDSEITISNDFAMLYLRVSNGRALALSRLGNGICSIGVVTTGLDLTSSSIASAIELLRIQASDVPGGYTNLATNVWTFGASGFDVYVKINGVEAGRVRDYTHVDAGTAALWSNSGGRTISQFSVAYVPATLIGSNRSKRLIDIRDLGAKSTATASATGNMAAGSNQLTSVSNTAGFAVGDQIIVEIGGEAGLGRRGSEGVGGAWPALSYLTDAAVLADTTQTEGTRAWSRATGTVFRYLSGVWLSTITPTDTYYTQKALPLSLVAKITAISGSTFTLDHTAVAATTGAQIYVDALPSFAPLTVNVGWVPDYQKLLIPEGEFALSYQASNDFLPNGFIDGLLGFQIIGKGKTLSTLFSPKGTPSVGITIGYSRNALVKGIHFRGNAVVGTSGELDGYGLINFYSWPQTLHYKTGTNCTAMDCSFENVVAAAFTCDSCSEAWGYRMELQQDHPAEAYTGWQFQHVGSGGGGLEDITVTCPKIIKAFEMFGSSGQTYTRCGGTNAILSTNSSNGWLIDEYHSTITVDAAKDIYIGAGYLGEAVIYPSANAFHSAVYGTIRNPRIIQQGYADTTDNSAYAAAISVTPDCTGVIIEGQYAGTTTPFSTTLGGYIEGPTWDAGARFNSANAILDQGQNTIIRGIRAVGSTNTANGNGLIGNAGGATWAAGSGASTIQDCIADTFGIRSGTTKSGNRTNAGVAVP